MRFLTGTGWGWHTQSWLGKSFAGHWHECLESDPPYWWGKPTAWINRCDAVTPAGSDDGSSGNRMTEGRWCAKLPYSAVPTPRAVRGCKAVPVQGSSDAVSLKHFPALDLAAPCASLALAQFDKLLEALQVSLDPRRHEPNSVAHSLDHALGAVIDLEH
jgi:hypothetical protein